MPYVFGYGSLVDRASLEATIGRSLAPVDGPHPARLRGFRRCWNMAAHSSTRPEFTFADGAGKPWEGWVVFLGLEQSSAVTVTLGALYRVEAADFTELDIRERSYNRVDVTAQIESDVEIPPSETVSTYVTMPEVRGHARSVGACGTIMARYLRLIDRAYRALGQDLYAEHLMTLPPYDTFAIDEITAAPIDIHTRNQVLDPDRHEQARAAGRGPGRAVL